ncbi:chromatin assembly factor 1 subunit A isoform X1 [Dendroctonus ponderosae]|uniref:chromatin assembly factor 1 subunit A isoform X1 n=2 Tax=Dendroctonus ponderosae TaxID=77166 RepID=UPI00203590AC|nr:chromatin assembly factor 1 subunit A isoform X1 [Dendroctonus ponderosae]
MFALPLAKRIIQESTFRTWNCIATIAYLIWSKFGYLTQPRMPRSRKRHHSRSRSKTRSRSLSGDRGHDKAKKPSSHEKDGKRRRLEESVASPQKRSISSADDQLEIVDKVAATENVTKATPSATPHASATDESLDSSSSDGDSDCVILKAETSESLKDSIMMEVIYDKKEIISTPKKNVTPKKLQKMLDSEKKRQQKQHEKEEREKQKQEEKAKLLADKQKLKEQKEAEKQKQLEEKQRQIELKQKEKELKEEQKQKEKEEKEMKRKEKEELEARKRKEKEEERLKKLQEIEEKNKEKQKEEELKQKSAALFKNFFKKTDEERAEELNQSKAEKINSNFMPFAVKSDMKLPPRRRQPLTEGQLKLLDSAMQSQNGDLGFYLKCLKSGEYQPGVTGRTWPYEESEGEVTIVEDDKVLGQTICEDTGVVQKMKVKFLFFHENRRPAYYGTWRKTSKRVTPRRPFAEDTDFFNYEEDSDDDWEDEEQGESLDVSGDEEDKENATEEDDYEVDNEFFVPHGHLSEDEIDDEENAPLSPESLKQKLKLLKDEFELDIKSKTHKLKSRSIGCIWFNEGNDNIDEAIYRYLQPFAMLVQEPVEIKDRLSVFGTNTDKKTLKVKVPTELPCEHVPYFLKTVHGNVNKKRTVIEEFLTLMANKGLPVDISKAGLFRFLKQIASYRRPTSAGASKAKCWCVNDEAIEKYNVHLDMVLEERSTC